MMGQRLPPRKTCGGLLLLPELRLRADLIGVVSVFADDAGRLLASTARGDARDVRLRVAASGVRFVPAVDSAGDPDQAVPARR